MPWDVVHRRLVDDLGNPDPGNQDFTFYHPDPNPLAAAAIPPHVTQGEAQSRWEEATRPEPWDADRIIDTIAGLPLLPLKVLSGLDQVVKGGLGIPTLADSAASGAAMYGGQEYDAPNAVDRFIGQITGDPRRQEAAAARISNLIAEREASRRAAFAEEKAKLGLEKGGYELAERAVQGPFLFGNAFNAAERAAEELSQLKQYGGPQKAATLYGTRLGNRKTENEILLGEEFDRPDRLVTQHLQQLREEQEEAEARARDQFRNMIQPPRQPGQYSLLEGTGALSPGQEVEPGAVEKFTELVNKLRTRVNERGETPEQEQARKEREAGVGRQERDTAIARIADAIKGWKPADEKAVEASRSDIYGGKGLLGYFTSDRPYLYEKDAAANHIAVELGRAIGAGDISLDDALKVAGGQARIENVVKPDARGKYSSPAKWDAIMADIRGVEPPSSQPSAPQPAPSPTPSYDAQKPVPTEARKQEQKASDADLKAEFKLRWNKKHPGGGENTASYRALEEMYLKVARERGR